MPQYVGEQGKENRWPEDQPLGGAQDAQRPQPTWLSSKRSLAAVTGERLEIERLTSRSEEGRWKSTHRGNSLAAYPTSRPVLRRGDGSNPGSLAGDQRQHREHRLDEHAVLPRPALTLHIGVARVPLYTTIYL